MRASPASASGRTASRELRRRRPSSARQRDPAKAKVPASANPKAAPRWRKVAAAGAELHLARPPDSLDALRCRPPSCEEAPDKESTGSSRVDNSGPRRREGLHRLGFLGFGAAADQRGTTGRARARLRRRRPEASGTSRSALPASDRLGGRCRRGRRGRGVSSRRGWRAIAASGATSSSVSPSATSRSSSGARSSSHDGSIGRRASRRIFGCASARPTRRRPRAPRAASRRAARRRTRSRCLARAPCPRGGSCCARARGSGPARPCRARRPGPGRRSRRPGRPAETASGIVMK